MKTENMKLSRVFLACLILILLIGMCSCKADELNQQPTADFEQVGNMFYSTSTDDKGIESYRWDTNCDMRWDLFDRKIVLTVLPDTITLEVADYEGWSDRCTKQVYVN